MSTGSIDVTSADGIRILTINRPDKRNAFTPALCVELQKAFEAFRDSEDRVAILTGKGSFFSAGADLTSPPKEFWRSFPELGVDIGKPVIAALPGPAIGLGVGILMFCDLVVAADTATLIYPEAKVGIAKGLIAALTVRVPQKIAMELILLGEPVSAQRGYEAGLINRVVPADQVMNEALRMARVLSQNAPKVVRMLKTLIGETLPKSPVEKACFAQGEVEAVENSEDAAEGLRAFAEKRKPVFRDR